MKLFGVVAAFALAPSLLSVQQEPQTAGIVQGTVALTLTGEPVAGAQVTLSAIAPMPPGSAEVLAAFPPGIQLTPSMTHAINSAAGQMTLAPITPASSGLTGAARSGLHIGLTTTDAAGRFVFSNVPAGEYVIASRRDGFFAPSALGAPGSTVVNTAPFDVMAERPTPDIALTMNPGGVVSGAVREPDGNPVPGIRVSAFQIGYQPDGRVELRPVNTKQTDARGAYKLFWLAPGEYLIGVTPARPDAAADSKSSFMRTFFPGVIDPFLASSIVVKEAGDLAEVNIVFQERNTVKVFGQVVHAAEEPNGPASPVSSVAGFHILPSDPRKSFFDIAPAAFSNMASDRTNGQFEIRGVPPGFYDLVAIASDARGRLTAGRTPIEVGNGDLRGVTVAIPPGVEVKAGIVYEGGSPPDNTVNGRLFMRAGENDVAPFDSGLQTLSPLLALPPPGATGAQSVPVPAVDAMGANTFSNVPEGQYTFQITGLPASAYIAGIRHGDSDVVDGRLHVGAEEPARIDVVVNLAGETVEGDVVNAEQRLLPMATVVLIPQHERRENRSFYKVTTADAAGHFSIRGVAPGEYKVFSWAVAPPPNAFLNTAFMTRFEAFGQTFQAGSAVHAALKVQAIP